MRSNDFARVASRRVGSFAVARETSRVDVSRSGQIRARRPRARHDATVARRRRARDLVDVERVGGVGVGGGDGGERREEASTLRANATPFDFEAVRRAAPSAAPFGGKGSTRSPERRGKTLAEPEVGRRAGNPSSARGRRRERSRRSASGCR